MVTLQLSESEKGHIEADSDCGPSPCYIAKKFYLHSQTDVFLENWKLSIRSEIHEKKKKTTLHLMLKDMLPNIEWS